MHVMKGNFETKREVDVDVFPLPCPFCGRRHGLYDRGFLAPSVLSPDHWAITCVRDIAGGCGAQLVRKTRDEALLAWNSRVKT